MIFRHKEFIIGVSQQAVAPNLPAVHTFCTVLCAAVSLNVPVFSNYINVPPNTKNSSTDNVIYLSFY